MECCTGAYIRVDKVTLLKWQPEMGSRKQTFT